VEAQAYPEPGRWNVLVSSQSIRSAMRGCGTCLVYHINKGLCVFPDERTDCVTRIVTRENGLDQRGELMRSESACDQTSAGWGVGVVKEEESGTINIPRKTAKVG
jgi:hypothetical protein